MLFLASSSIVACCILMLYITAITALLSMQQSALLALIIFLAEFEACLVIFSVLLAWIGFDTIKRSKVLRDWYLFIFRTVLLTSCVLLLVYALALPNCELFGAFLQQYTYFSNFSYTTAALFANSSLLTIISSGFLTVAALDLFILNILLFCVIIVILLAQRHTMLTRVFSTGRQAVTRTTAKDCVLLRQQSQRAQLLRTPTLRTLYLSKLRRKGVGGLKKKSYKL